LGGLVVNLEVGKSSKRLFPGKDTVFALLCFVCKQCKLPVRSDFTERLPLVNPQGTVLCADEAFSLRKKSPATNTGDTLPEIGVQGFRLV